MALSCNHHYQVILLSRDSCVQSFARAQRGDRLTLGALPQIHWDFFSCKLNPLQTNLILKENLLTYKTEKSKSCIWLQAKMNSRGSCQVSLPLPIYHPNSFPLTALLCFPIGLSQRWRWRWKTRWWLSSTWLLTTSDSPVETASHCLFM